MDIKQRIRNLQKDIQQVQLHTEPSLHKLKLIAVSKGHSAQAIQQAFNEGLVDFGESYLQEAETKIQALNTLPICWHYIGPIQSNKADRIAKPFSWVHSIDRPKIALKLNDHRPDSLAPLNICLQINFDQEESKSGIHPDDAAELAAYVMQLPHLRLRGLMMIPKPQSDEEAQYLSFLRATHLLHMLNKTLDASMDTLSMGMSHDWQAAIRAGSTMLRLGTAIFGERS